MILAIRGSDVGAIPERATSIFDRLVLVEMTEGSPRVVPGVQPYFPFRLLTKALEYEYCLYQCFGYRTCFVGCGSWIS